jgi:glycosyltransferase 2 family protein
MLPIVFVNRDAHNDNLVTFALTILKICLTVAVLVVLIRAVGWNELSATLATAKWSWLLAMYMVTLVALWIAAAQLKLLFAKIGVRVSVGRILLASSLAALYSLVLPGEVAAGVAKWADLSAATGQKTPTLYAIVYTKLSNMIPVVAAGAVAITVEDPFQGSPTAEIIAGLAIFVSATTLWLFHARPGSWADRLVATCVRRCPPTIGLRLETLNESLAVFRSLRWTDHLHVYSLGVVAFAMSILGFVCTLKTLELAIPATVVLWALAALMIARQLPITINNLGVREGLLVVMLGGYGVGPPVAVALGLIGFSNVVLVALIGASYQAVLTVRTTV